MAAANDAVATGRGDDRFELYDLRVEWVGEAPCWCKAKPGDHFELHGEQLHFPPGQSWSIYTLAPLLPLLPAKQRMTHPNDWMSTDARVACPDPNCNAHFRITRCGKRTFSHAAVTAVSLEGNHGGASKAARKPTGKATSTKATPNKPTPSKPKKGTPR